jgi:adenylate cyclase
MATEIERKFLVEGSGWRASAGAGIAYRQGYLAITPRCAVRVRIADGGARLAVKGASPGARRAEFEYPVPLGDAEEMLATLCARPPVEKTRYEVLHRGHRWEVDVFEGANAGLVLAEVELVREDEPVELPSWVGAEVTDDPRYYNATLAECPYRDWGPGAGGPSRSRARP